MPVSYKVDRENGFILTVASGIVVGEEMIAHVAELSVEPDLPKPLRELWDGRRIERFDVTSEQTRQILEVAKEAADRFGNAYIATVAARNSVYGMARMLQAFAANSPFTFEVFRDIEQARNWLEESRDRTEPPDDFPFISKVDP